MEALAVELGAVAAAQIGYPIAALRRFDARVVARDRIESDREVIVLLATHAERAAHEDDALPLVQHGCGCAGWAARGCLRAARAGLHQRLFPLGERIGLAAHAPLISSEMDPIPHHAPAPRLLSDWRRTLPEGVHTRNDPGAA